MTTRITTWKLFHKVKNNNNKFVYKNENSFSNFFCLFFSFSFCLMLYKRTRKLKYKQKNIIWKIIFLQQFGFSQRTKRKKRWKKIIWKIYSPCIFVVISSFCCRKAVYKRHKYNPNEKKLYLQKKGKKFNAKA